MAKVLITLGLFFVLAMPLSNVSAETDPVKSGTTDPNQTQTAPSSINLPNPLPGVSTIPGLIGKVITAVLGIVGSLALAMFIYGGFTWMLSGGNSQAIDRGKNILIWAAVGLVVIFISYALISFIITTISS